ncbi:protein argonaute 3-like [Triticum aestivum]|uniref:protein argonaute 3-like n=1 Tax=Triticum aestivum TaxID=4565 RepID=UPI001D00EBFE|nr:protein argonaute 3-like [Triticum aestivum]
MANDEGRGHRGERRGGGGAGRMDRGGGRQAGRGNGRGGDRSKFSWRREEGDSHGISTSSNVASAEDTARWDEAAASNRQEIQSGGVWVQKAQTPAGAGGTATGKQPAPPPDRPQGKQIPAQVYCLLKTGRLWSEGQRC